MSEVAIKVIIVGNGQVGKTSMIKRFASGEYDDKYKKTIGAAFKEKELFIKSANKTVKFMLWDTAGQEEYDSVTRRYYRGAGCAVVAFSTIDRDSFKAVEKWKKKVDEECDEIPTCLIQNKIDLIKDKVVENEEGDELASKLGVKFIRTCVKDNTNVDEVFEYLAEEYLKTRGDQEEEKKEEIFELPVSSSSKKKACNVI
eukprot:gene4705-8289_t